MYRALIPESCLKAVVVTNRGYQNTPQTTFLQEPEPGPKDKTNETCKLGGGEVISRWFQHPFDRKMHTVQFACLSHAFQLVLREEERQQERYSHVARMRTDGYGSLAGLPTLTLSH